MNQSFHDTSGIVTYIAMRMYVPCKLPVCEQVVLAKRTPLLQGRGQHPCVVDIAPDREGMSWKQRKDSAQGHYLSCYKQTLPTQHGQDCMKSKCQQDPASTLLILCCDAQQSVQHPQLVPGAACARFRHRSQTQAQSCARELKSNATAPIGSTEHADELRILAPAYIVLPLAEGQP